MCCAGFLRGQLAALQLTKRPQLCCAACRLGRVQTAAGPFTAGQRKHAASCAGRSSSLHPSWPSRLTGGSLLTAARTFRSQPLHEQQHRGLHQHASRARTAIRAAQTDADSNGSAGRDGGSSGGRYAVVSLFFLSLCPVMHSSGCIVMTTRLCSHRRAGACKHVRVCMMRSTLQLVTT